MQKGAERTAAPSALAMSSMKNSSRCSVAALLNSPTPGPQLHHSCRPQQIRMFCYRPTVAVCQPSQVGETVSFLLGRFLLRKWVAELTADWPMWAALNAALREDGWKLVLLLRMSPAMPFSVINYALGSSSLPVSVKLPV